MNILSTRDLCFCYGNADVFLLYKLNCDIKKNKFTAIIGPNGSGKSTLFKCLSGIYTAHKGEVILKGKNIQKISKEERAKTLAIIQQKNELGAKLTIEEIVEFGRIPYNSKKIGYTLSKNDKNIINETLKKVGIFDLKDKYFQELSGGQQQRVWLALALVQEPEIILLDEPTNFLDIMYQLELLDMLRKMVDSNQLTVCAILHDINQVRKYADYVIILKQGKIISHGSTKNVINEDVIFKTFGVHAKTNSNLFDFSLEIK